MSLAAFQFCKPALSSHGVLPAYMYFQIRGRMLWANNGKYCLCSPVDLDFDCAPHGEQLLRALAACQTGTPAFSLEPNGKLLVKCGKLRVLVDCWVEQWPAVAPEGKRAEIAVPILPTLRYLLPFVSKDETRKWACGILLEDECAYATNNIVLLQVWLGAKAKLRVNLPAEAVEILLQVGEEPAWWQMTDNRVVFHFSGGRWLSSQLFEQVWPDVNTMLDGMDTAGLHPFPPGFFEAVETLLPFTMDKINRVYFSEAGLSTHSESALAGASVALAGLPAGGCYNAAQLLSLRAVANEINFAAYPRCPIAGPVARGLIVGITK